MTVNTGKLSFFFFLLETQTAAAQGAAKMPSCSVGEKIRRVNQFLWVPVAMEPSSFSECSGSRENY